LTIKTNIVIDLHKNEKKMHTEYVSKVEVQNIRRSPEGITACQTAAKQTTMHNPHGTRGILVSELQVSSGDQHGKV
jgi:hypothetical protein